MRIRFFTFCIFAAATLSCNTKETKTNTSDKTSLSGTWELISARIIAGGDTTATFPIAGQQMIKMFNDTHFSFFKHDLRFGKGDSAVFDAGSGKYSLKGEVYMEHLEYCNYRDWENRDFHFNVKVHNDTLIQSGIEKIDSLNINQEILEIYVKR